VKKAISNEMAGMEPKDEPNYRTGCAGPGVPAAAPIPAQDLTRARSTGCGALIASIR
jgi:hypothetical protein